jgi:hypothetical protein
MATQEQKERIAEILLDWRDGRKNVLIETVIEKIEDILKPQFNFDPLLFQDNDNYDIGTDLKDSDQTFTVEFNFDNSDSEDLGNFDANIIYDSMDYDKFLSLYIGDFVPNCASQPLYDDYYGHRVEINPEGFQGWADFDESNPVWQMQDGRYIPLNIMKDDHLVACYRMINESLKSYAGINKSMNPLPEKSFIAIKEKWEEVLFDEANSRGLAVRLYD